MSQLVKITKLAESKQKGVCKVGFMYEFIDDVNRKHSGSGRFATLDGSAENYPHCIKQDLERRLGRAINLEMPEKYTRQKLSLNR